MTKAVSAKELVPVTLVTGFLGAGKTTLINHLLTNDSGLRFAVIVNEFGAIGIDHDLIVSSTETLLELSNGCVCCTIRSDLVTSLRALLAGPQSFDGIFIETTGLADPAPVIQTFMFDQLLASKARLDAVVTIVDAVNICAHMERFEESVHQLLNATIIIVNKADLADASTLEGIEGGIGALNPAAICYRTSWAKLPLESLLGLNGFDTVRVADELAAHKNQTTHEETNIVANAHHVTSQSFFSDQPLDLVALENRLVQIMQKYGQNIIRMKGIFDIVGHDDRLVFQAVHMMSDAVWSGQWPAGVPRQSRLVVIGQNLGGMALLSELEWFQAA